MIVHLNGEWVEADRAVIPIDDRGFLFGDAVFETVRLHGGAFFRFLDHAARLRTGAGTLSISCPPVDTLHTIAGELVRRNAITDGMLRITITRGRHAGVRIAHAGPPTVLVMIRPMPADWRARAVRGWRVITARTPHPPPAAMPRGLKAQSRVYNILARLEAEAAGADDALLLTPDGLVAEGPTWNVFWRRGGRLFTPGPDTGILEGITRAVVIDLAARLGLHVEQGAWPRAVLDRADEAFATMSSLGPVPITRLDGRPLRPRADDVAARLAALYWSTVEAEASPPP